MSLTVRECMVLDFQRRRWKYAGAQVEAIRFELGMTSTRYHQVLNALIDRPEALAYDAQTVNRLRRLREQRRAARRARAS